MFPIKCSSTHGHTPHTQRRNILIAVLVGALVLLQGCASQPRVDPKETNVALVYGYIDMSDAPSAVDWVRLSQYKMGKQEEIGYTIDAEDGIFFHVGVDMGSYQITSFGRYTRWYSNTAYNYDFGVDGKNETAAKITKPGVYYLGAYAYKSIRSKSFWGPDSFTVVPAKSPTEKELLQKVQKRLEEDNSEYTHQIAWVKKRLAELK